jgi:hypothetical protein
VSKKTLTITKERHLLGERRQAMPLTVESSSSSSSFCVPKKSKSEERRPLTLGRRKSLQRQPLQSIDHVKQLAKLQGVIESTESALSNPAIIMTTSQAMNSFTSFEKATSSTLIIPALNSEAKLLAKKRRKVIS